MKRVELTKEKLCTLRGGLPRGAQKEIAERLGVTQECVSRVLNGHEKSDKVIKAALKLYNEEQEKNDALIEIINQL